MSASAGDGGHKGWPMEQGTIRTAALVVLVPSFVLFGFWSGVTLVTIQRDIADLKLELVKASADRFSRAEFAEWCHRHERANPGVSCESPYDLSTYLRGQRTLQR